MIDKRVTEKKCPGVINGKECNEPFQKQDIMEITGYPLIEEE